jgi:hypothetical protein
VSQGTVKSQASKAIASLRKKLVTGPVAKPAAGNGAREGVRPQVRSEEGGQP